MSRTRHSCLFPQGAQPRDLIAALLRRATDTSAPPQARVRVSAWLVHLCFLASAHRTEGRSLTCHSCLRCVFHTPQEREAAAAAAAAVANKAAADGDAASLAAFQEVLSPPLLSQSGSAGAAAAVATGWLATGLAMRGSPAAASVALPLLALLPHPDCGAPAAAAAAEALGRPLRGPAPLLSRRTHAAQKPLAEQRFFTAVLPPVLEALRGCGAGPARGRLCAGAVGYVRTRTSHVALSHTPHFYGFTEIMRGASLPPVPQRWRGCSPAPRGARSYRSCPCWRLSSRTRSQRWSRQLLAAAPPRQQRPRRRRRRS